MICSKDAYSTGATRPCFLMERGVDTARIVLRKGADRIFTQELN
jgi:hypothetical protein